MSVDARLSTAKSMHDREIGHCLSCYPRWGIMICVLRNRENAHSWSLACHCRLLRSSILGGAPVLRERYKSTIETRRVPPSTPIIVRMLLSIALSNPVQRWLTVRADACGGGNRIGPSVGVQRSQDVCERRRRLAFCRQYVLRCRGPHAGESNRKVP